jgi:Resolvase, N terminal domain
VPGWRQRGPIRASVIPALARPALQEALGRRGLTRCPLFPLAAGYVVDDADRFYDPAVSGADPIESRPGFSALLSRIEGNGVRVVIVEGAGRFARSLVTQELRIINLRSSACAS